MSSTTFGYNAAEDRIWMSNSLWSERLWITRNSAQQILHLVGKVLEDSAKGQEPHPGARAAREHDAAINRPQMRQGPALQMGRETAAASAQHAYVLIGGVTLTMAGPNADLSLHTPAGDRTMAFDREGLHRWLHAFYAVIKQTDWALSSLPPWITGSYLPPALRAIFEAPIVDLTDDDGDDLPPTSPPSPGKR